MAKITFNKLGYKVNSSATTEMRINDSLSLDIIQYLPIQEKANLITFVVDQAVDEHTGCFSPIRVEVYFNLALAKWYAGIQFSEKQLQDGGKTYDALESNGFFEALRNNIGKDFSRVQDMLDETLKDIVRYNNSFAGMINVMTSDAAGLNGNLQSILEQIKNKEGLETLSAIQDVVGTD